MHFLPGPLLHSSSAFSAIAAHAPPVLPSFPDVLCCETSPALPALMSVYCSFENCYPFSRSTSLLSTVIGPLSAQITDSLSPSVIRDRPSHPTYRLHQQLPGQIFAHCTDMKLA
jgi:hypothetical protein